MGFHPQTPEVYPLWEYPVKMKKSSNISVTALHRFIPQPASGRSSELSLLSFCPCLDCIFSMVRILAIIAFTRFDFQNRQAILPFYPTQLQKVFLPKHQEYRHILPQHYCHCQQLLQKLQKNPPKINSGETNTKHQ